MIWVFLGGVVVAAGRTIEGDKEKNYGLRS